MANWFVALPVSPLGWFERHVPPPPEGLRRFHPDDLHLTIAFLGAVSADAAGRGWDALRWDLPPCPVTLGPVVPMGSDRRYSALSALLVQGREEVEQAIAQARIAVWRAAGARADDRPAKAHLTVARPRRRAGARELQAGLRWARELDLREVQVLLDRVALYTRADEEDDRRFRIVAEHALDDPEEEE